MSYIPSELVTLGIKFKERRVGFHPFMSRVEDECKTIDKSENDKRKWDIAISLRGFLDTILDSSKLDLNAEQEKRVIKLRGILNKAVLESKVMNF
ncbi:hypothetical protein R1T43_19175 [Alteromonas sp. CI.11.F.A3]|uniref:hypothetical protein n=1 Tax=Alteromonas sp. CI.11.F.A3 TaxID=3079555 RepID=UPI0029422969|nr:hypothetical protein [Alteromonas sp. CI.11.F.A3]WOI37285.1 hypothetical protein R1T43_19175 [Alteromonas sp. CI.11.F.A3]